MATLSIWNYFSLPVQGSENTGKQGSSTDAPQTSFDITVTGTIDKITGSLATATVRTLFDDDADFPIDWDYLHYWADQDSYIQIIGSATNVILKVEAKVPFVLSFDSMLAAANTTIITGGTEPTLTDIDSIVIGNYSGSTMNFTFAVVD